VKEIFLILHDIRSSENVGSIFRTADAAGVSRIFLTGYTPAPLDRFARPNAKLTKAALGAEGFVPWEKRENILALIRELKGKGFSVAAVEQAPGSLHHAAFSAEKAALIFGNEVQGLPVAVIEASDVVLEIPMRGKKESLNVSVAAGIVLFSPGVSS
jgi:tRNA G18 (ribose-2'-O)-methylase SpoU